MSGLPVINRDRGGQTNTGDEADIVISIRRRAATGIERSPMSDGNVESNEGSSAPKTVGKTKPPAPAKSAPDRNKAAKEATPPYAKESLAGDGWARAREAARKMHRGK